MASRRTRGIGHRLRAAMLASLSLLSSLSGCCCGSSETVAKLETPVRVTWEVSKGWKETGGGRGAFIPFWWVVDSTITVHGAEALDISAGCHEPEPQLSMSPDGGKLAYRCGNDDEWRLYYLGSRKRRFKDCKAALGAGALDWSKVPSLEQRAPELLQCLNMCWWSRHNYEPFDEDLFAELERGRTPSDMARLLVEVADRLPCSEPHWNLREPDCWDDAFQRLPQAERDAAVSALRTRLEQADPAQPPLFLLWRYSRWLRLADESVAERMLSWIEPIASGEHAHVPRDQAMVLVDRMLERLIAVRPAETGQAACALTTRGPGEYRNMSSQRPSVLLAIAHARTSCPELRKALQHQKLAFCPGPGGKSLLCSERELTPYVKQRIETLPLPFDKPSEEGEERSKVLLAAVRAQGPLPDWALLAEKRASYRMDQPSQEACCATAEDKCLCVDKALIPELLPLGEPVESELEYSPGCCRLIFDDKKGVIRIENRSWLRTERLAAEGGEGGS